MGKNESERSLSDPFALRADQKQIVHCNGYGDLGVYSIQTLHEHTQITVCVPMARCYFTVNSLPCVSTYTVAPSPILPDRIRSATLSSTADVIKRFKGRAPNTGS